MEVFKNFSLQQLLKIAQQEAVPISKDDSKSEIRKKIYIVVEDIGISQLLEQLKKEDLKSICDNLEIDHGANNPHAKTVMKKRLMERMRENGLLRFLQDHCEKQHLVLLFRAFLDEIPIHKNKGALIEQLCHLVHIAGLQAFLIRFDVSFLKELAFTLDLECNSDSKQKIVLGISTQSAIAKEERKTEHLFSKTKQPIKVTRAFDDCRASQAGITYQDIFQHYYREELIDWCRDHDLKATGTKNKLIHRILEYLEDDNKENSSKKGKTNEQELTDHTEDEQVKPAKSKTKKIAK